jgi:hypothetical protein
LNPVVQASATPHRTSAAVKRSPRIGSTAELTGQGTEHRVVVAVGRACHRGGCALLRPVYHRGLERRAIEDEPAEIRPAQRIADARSETRFREKVREVHVHGGLLGDDRIAVTYRWHLAHRVDRQVLGLALLPGLQIEDVKIVVAAQLLEQREHAGRTRVWPVIERESPIVRHGQRPCVSGGWPHSGRGGAAKSSAIQNRQGRAAQ